jgi:hypothetical protein
VSRKVLRLLLVTKEIVEKGVLFFVAPKRAVLSPRLPRNPPRFHHKSTTRIHRFSQNTLKNPSKTHKIARSYHELFSATK